MFVSIDGDYKVPASEKTLVVLYGRSGNHKLLRRCS